MNIQVQNINDTFFRLSELSDLRGDGELLPGVDAYLLTGEKRAVLVDTLQNATGLYEKVRELTELPLDVLITHGHIDHAGKSLPEFVAAGCAVYMPEVDFEFLHSMEPGVKKEWFHNLKDGDVWELGGRTLHTLSCAGHTAGSVVLYDPKENLLLTGDAVGAGNFWMHIPGALPLSEFLKSLAGLREKIRDPEQVRIYTGHQIQAQGILTGTYLDELFDLTTDIVSRKIAGEEREATLLGKTFCYRVAARGQVHSLCYRVENVDPIRHLCP